jgi:Predicted metal-binding, possibly nucleic acid-binding protein
MIIDLTRLRSGIDKEIIVDETYSFSEEELNGAGVSSIDNIKVSGTISLNAISDVVIMLDIEGTMIIPCAVTLKPVEYPFNIAIDGDLKELCEEINEKDTNSQNRLDILPIIWENILMEIPMRIVSEGAENVSLSGDGWKLITDEDEIENSELSKLKDII